MEILIIADQNGLLPYLAANLTAWDYVAIAGLLLAAIALGAISAGAYYAAKTLLIFSSLVLWAPKIYNDYHDCDDVFYSSPGGYDCSPPPPPPPPPCSSQPCII
jgi:hypothetical protein